MDDAPTPAPYYSPAPLSRWSRQCVIDIFTDRTTLLLKLAQEKLRPTAPDAVRTSGPLTLSGLALQPATQPLMAPRLGLPEGLGGAWGCVPSTTL